MHKNQMLEKTLKSLGRLSENEEFKSITVRHIHKNSCKGIMIAFNIDDKIYIGHSFCDKKDVFSRKIGYEIAVNRAFATFNKERNSIAESAWHDYLRFMEKCYRYFKYSEVKYEFPSWYILIMEEIPSIVESWKKKDTM